MQSPYNLVGEVAKDIASCLEKQGVVYAITGAVAAAFWGVVRPTKDIDLLLLAERVRMPAVFERLNEIGCSIGLESALESIRKDFTVRTVCRSVPVEIFVPVLPWHHSALKRRVRKDVEGVPMWVMAAEDIVIFKTIFWRPKDVADIAGILSIQGEKIDSLYIRSWLDEMLPRDDDMKRMGQVERWMREFGCEH